MPGIAETKQLVRMIIMFAAGIAQKRPWTWFVGQASVVWQGLIGAQNVIVEVPDMDEAEEIELRDETADALADYDLGDEDVSYIAKEAISAIRHIVNIIVRLVAKDSTRE